MDIYITGTLEGSPWLKVTTRNVQVSRIRSFICHVSNGTATTGRWGAFHLTNVVIKTNCSNLKRWRPLWHASNSFGIIWAIVGIVLLIFILKNLSKLPSASSRGPYISLAIITFTFVVYYVLWGAIEWAKESTMTFVSVNSAYAAMNFLSAILVAFLPATILYIIQKRGALLRAAVGGDSLPISCRPWKKILDWFLVGATFCTLITLMALNIAVFRAIADMTIYFDKKLLYTEVRRGVGHAAVALGISLCLDVIVSLFIQSRQANRAKTPDPVRYNKTSPLILLTLSI